MSDEDHNREMMIEAMQAERGVTLRDLRLLTARALADWKADIESRLERAAELREVGALFPVEIEDLENAVTAWRMAASAVVLGPSNPALARDLNRCPICRCPQFPVAAA